MYNSSHDYVDDMFSHIMEMYIYITHNQCLCRYYTYDVHKVCKLYHHYFGECVELLDGGYYIPDLHDMAIIDISGV